MQGAWHAYKASFARLIIGTAVLLIAYVLLVMFSFLPLLLTAVSASRGMLFFSLSLFSLFALVAIGVAGLFFHGYLKFLSRASTRPSFITILKDAASGKRMAALAYAFVASLVVIFAIPYFYTSSSLSLLLAAPFAAAFLFFTALSPCVVIFGKLQPLEAWGKSFELVVASFWQFLWLSVILCVIGIAVLVIPAVGPALLFVIFPWMVLSYERFYEGCK